MIQNSPQGTVALLNSSAIARNATSLHHVWTAKSCKYTYMNNRSYQDDNTAGWHQQRMAVTNAQGICDSCRFHTSSTLLSGCPDALPCSLTWSVIFFSACLAASASRGCFSSSPKMEGKKSGRMRPSTRLASVIAGNPFFLQGQQPQTCTRKNRDAFDCPLRSRE